MRFLLLILLCSPCLAQSPSAGFPIVEERVDSFYVISSGDSGYSHVVFVRDGNVAATRLLIDEMVWSVEGDELCLTWRDYWTAERRVYAREYNRMHLPYDPSQEGKNGQWWCQWRNMRDLRQPE